MLYNQERREPGPVGYAERPRPNATTCCLRWIVHRLYRSRCGLERPQGRLSIDGGPDSLGIARWIFEIDTPALSAAISPDLGFNCVRAYHIDRQTAGARRTARERDSVPCHCSTRQCALIAASIWRCCRCSIGSTRRRRGLQRAPGLSISGGPYLAGIAT